MNGHGFANLLYAEDCPVGFLEELCFRDPTQESNRIQTMVQDSQIGSRQDLQKQSDRDLVQDDQTLAASN